jgi:hypothetical protein
MTERTTALVAATTELQQHSDRPYALAEVAGFDCQKL